MKKLKDVIVDGVILAGAEVNLSNISDNSKNVKEGSLFFAIKGTAVDGHNFVKEVLEKGACGVVVQDKQLADFLVKNYPGKAIVLSENTRKSLSLSANRFFDEPSKGLKVIGITGTNGKTSVSNILAQFYEFAGYKVGIIGTINYRIGDEIISAGHTTPDPINWFKTLKIFKEKGADVVVAEVSSHALDQYRVYGTVFDGGIFTNLTQDHLDYHKSMEDYFKAKEKLFYHILDFNQNPKASVNYDDEYGRKIYQKFKDNFNIISYGKTSPDFKIEDIRLSVSGTEFSFVYKGGKRRIYTKLLGEFNVYNLSASISYLLVDNFDEDFLIEKAKFIKPVRGRFEVLSENGKTVIVDYAHTPDGVEKLLSSVNQIKKDKVITIFGAGGNRDKTKRPIMGKIAKSLSDIVIITSDNPRNEEPIDIINDILKGIEDKTDVFVIPDREEAIKFGIEMAKEGDVIVIAGKGHETYQIIKDKILPFDDLEIAKKYLRRDYV
ncbi:MAG: UDP-N-acetylmuramoyl-L-alanyl-D-glutamate--2,6-diaminopimelate ligase [Hydrogenothermaceae bacterium]|nr:UDP-N-acetylmuramoyl-L-alanyl-D-glutamate--2,6-diaminopimelate ligase [Hydrogenothermaceae bacterium]